MWNIKKYINQSREKWGLALDSPAVSLDLPETLAALKLKFGPMLRNTVNNPWMHCLFVSRLLSAYRENTAQSPQPRVPWGSPPWTAPRTREGRACCLWSGAPGSPPDTRGGSGRGGITSVVPWFSAVISAARQPVISAREYLLNIQ